MECQSREKNITSNSHCFVMFGKCPGLLNSKTEVHLDSLGKQPIQCSILFLWGPIRSPDSLLGRDSEEKFSHITVAEWLWNHSNELLQPSDEIAFVWSYF
ncbi:low-density lipoprotein receptor-related protein 11 [Platysternon megacephalum]|uniref:Low-density lipoprotein receptor-related protein 11 n=1 Tax=Platysternon megacephalum TaxID=55544 RepID=A0A4D9EKW3_9SAUR|nr:low-density lipoprotein receptor-related protein 11 [Platysternon megacephalum]